MGHFDRAPKSERLAIAPLPERLVRLDRELESGSKDIDFVYAVRQEYGESYRIKVAITEMGGVARAERGFRYMATAFFAGKRHRTYGHRPSHTFIKMTEQLRWTTSRVTWERNNERSVAA